MNDEVRRKALIFLLIVAVLTVLIAAGLPQLRLQPGIPLPKLQNDGGAGQTPLEPPVTISVSTLFKIILAVILSLSVLFLIYKILRKVSWKKILLRFFYFAVLVLIGVGILLMLGNIRIGSRLVGPETLPPAVEREAIPLAPMPPDLMWLVWIGLALFVILLVVWLVGWRVRQRTEGDSLAVEAERALQALRLGQDFKNVIMQCYWQMSQSLRREQGIVLGESMTAREFEELAEARGIPPFPVHQLTQLFEAARYGFRQPGPEDEKKAVECLNAIVEYSHAKKQPD